MSGSPRRTSPTHRRSRRSSRSCSELRPTRRTRCSWRLPPARRRPTFDMTGRSRSSGAPSGSRKPFVSGVRMPPGATQFTRTPLLQVLDRERPGQVDDATFGRAVRGAEGLAHDPGVRRDVDDRAAAVEKVRQREAAHQERAGQVDRDDRGPAVRILLLAAGEPTDAGRSSPAAAGGRDRRPARPTAVCTDPGSLTSTVYAAAVAPPSLSSLATVSAASVARSRTATLAPSAANILAVARPRPEPAPVTTATRSVKRAMYVAPLAPQAGERTTSARAGESNVTSPRRTRRAGRHRLRPR